MVAIRARNSAVGTLQGLLVAGLVLFGFLKSQTSEAAPEGRGQFGLGLELQSNLQYGSLTGASLFWKISKWQFSFSSLSGSPNLKSEVWNEIERPQTLETSVKQANLDSYSSKIRHQNFSARWFPFADSFNIGMAYGSQKMDVSYLGSSTLADASISNQMTITAPSTWFCIGNAWHKSFYLISIDWLTLVIPKGATFTTSYNEKHSDSSLATLESDIETHASVLGNRHSVGISMALGLEF